MAEEKEKEAGEKGAEEAQAPKKSKKKLIIIIAAVVVLLGGGGGAFFMMKGGGEPVDEHAAAETEAKGGGGHGEEAEAAVSNIVKLEPFIVNLMEASGNRYLKVTINMEMPPSVMVEAQAKDAQIRDTIIILLSSKSYSDVGSVQGKYQLRDEIAARVNMALTTGKVKSVYFSEFVIQ